MCGSRDDLTQSCPLVASGSNKLAENVCTLKSTLLIHTTVARVGGCAEVSLNQTNYKMRKLEGISFTGTTLRKILIYLEI